MLTLVDNNICKIIVYCNANGTSNIWVKSFGETSTIAVGFILEDNTINWFLNRAPSEDVKHLCDKLAKLKSFW